MTTPNPVDAPDDSPNGLSDRLSMAFYRHYYQEAIAELAQKYPNEQRSLEVDWYDVFTFDPDLADDILANPEEIRPYFEEGLRLYDLSIDITLDAHVRFCNIPDAHTYYPGEFSPSEHLGHYRAIGGEITKSSDVYPKILGAAFECQLCATITRIPQSDGDFQEPHECQGCDRKGPFRVDLTKSEFIDAQKVRIKTPPELGSQGGQKIDAYVEDDIAGEVTIGDRVTISGVIQFDQETSGNQKKAKFNPYLEGRYVHIERTDQQDLDVEKGERKRIEALADGAEGDALDVAAESLAPKIYGYETLKKSLILAMASGGQISYPTGDTDRADLHVLILGDPGTAKSKLIDRAHDIGYRTVAVSSKRASVPGLTAAAEQDDFGDGEWSLKAGAFVKANGGTVCIDELDDMPPDTRAAMLEPMANQKFSASVAGENVTFQTEASVVAAGNPKDGRFNPYEPIPQQFEFDPALISRFDLVFTVKDVPDPEEDRKIADHILDARDAAKREDLDGAIADGGTDTIDVPVEPDLLPKWLALARQRPNPPFKSDAVKEMLRDNWAELRGMYDYDANEPIPVTFRKLEGIVRVAEAVAKFEFSDTITERHARTALGIVGVSMSDIGKNEDGELDADVQEIGESKDQKKRKDSLKEAVLELDSDYDGGVPREDIIEYVREEMGLGYTTSLLHSDIDSWMDQGLAIERDGNRIRYLGPA